MAGSKLLSKLLGILKGMFNKIPSMLNGFDVTETVPLGDYMFSQTVTSSTVNNSYGNPLTLKISVAATNVNNLDVIKNFQAALNNAVSAKQYQFTKDDTNMEKRGLVPIVGEACIDQVSKGLEKLWSDNARPGTFLNPMFDGSNLQSAANDIKTEGVTTWYNLLDNMTFDLMCECPGYDTGKKGGLTLDQLVECIRQYPVLCGAVQQNMMPTDIITDPIDVVLPIVVDVQQAIKSALDETSELIYNEKADDDNSSDTDDQSNPNDNQNTDNTPDDTNAENSAENTEPMEGEPTPQMNSKKINMKLQKITGSTDVSLMAIKANFNPGEALDVVDDVLSSQDFLDLITETPQSYEVLVDDEGYDVNPCTDLIVNPNEEFTALFTEALQFSRHLHMIHWLSIGNDMEKLHIKAEELYGELDQEIDLLAELIVEKTGNIDDIGVIQTIPVGADNFTFQEGIAMIGADAQSFIDHIDITYPNQTSDVQSVLDDWLRYWNKQLNYFIRREQEI